MAVYETDVYFLTTELKLMKLELKLNGRPGYQENAVPIEGNPKVEDFFCEKVNGGCKITYITDKGLIKEFGSGADQNKSLDCTKHTQNVNYWNKVVKVGNCVLAAGYTNTEDSESNSVVLGEEYVCLQTLSIPSSSSLGLTSGYYPVLRMLEIPSKKHKNVTFVLAAECYYISHLLALTLGKTKRMVKVDSKQVSSSSSKIMLLEGFPYRSLCAWKEEQVYFGMDKGEKGNLRRLKLIFS